MNKIRIAIVGIGNIGKRHIAVIDADPNTVLSGICDINEDKCQTQSDLYNGIPIYTDFNKMFDEVEADVISICSPHYLHKSMTLAAIEKGFNVLVEKPMALKVEDAQEMIDAANKKGVKLYVVKQNRFNVPVKLVKEVIDEGRLGKVYMVQCNVLWNRNTEYYTESDWRGNKTKEGGALFTQVSHFIDLMIWLFGSVIEAKANIETLKHDIEVEDSGVATLKFDSDVLGSVLWTTCVYNKNHEGSITIIGEKGTIKIGGQYLNKIDFWDVESFPLPNNINFVDLPNNYGKYQGTSSNHDKVIKELVKDMNNQSGNTVLGDEGIKSIEAIQMIYDNAKH